MHLLSITEPSLVAPKGVAASQKTNAPELHGQASRKIPNHNFLNSASCNLPKTA